MKIAFDAYPIASPKLSGVGVHALEIASRMCACAELDCVLLLYDFLKRRHSERILRERIPDTGILQNPFLPYGVYVELWNLVPQLGLKQVFGETADIYHFFNFVCPPNVPGKIINTVHDLVYLKFPETMEKRNFRRLKMHLKRSCDQSDLIITVSETVKRELTELLNLPEEKIRVVYNGVDGSRFRPDAGRLTGMPEHYFLSLGTLEPRKNLLGLLEAYRIAKPDVGDCKLVIGGAKGWEYTVLFEKVKEYGLESDVIFPGYLPADDLPKLYAGAQAFVFPSLYEGFGIPPLEAMSCGVPVIASDCSCIPEITGDAALLVTPKNAEELAGAMKRMLTDTELRNRCVARGLERAKQFTWERAAKRVLEIYQEE